MKTILFVLFVVAVGVAVGIGVATLRVGPKSPLPETMLASVEKSRADSTESKKATPKVVVDKNTFDFGSTIGKNEGSHDFAFSNAGDAPLHLTFKEADAALTTAFESVTLEPGASTKIAIAWKADWHSPTFSQTATITANDPNQPKITLTISGQVQSALQLSPEVLAVERMSADEPSVVTACLSCNVDQPLNITGHTMANAAIAQFFDVSFAPIADDELKKTDPQAKSGLQATVTVKQGMPPGTFIQQIVLKTNVAVQEEFIIPVVGAVASDINLIGREWNRNSNTLVLGVVSSKAGRQSRLTFLVRGPHRKDVKFKLTKATPGLLKVTFGEATESENGQVMQTPVTIEIPPGSPPAAYLGADGGPTGEIVIETTHPQVPKIPLTVRFAVGN